MSIVRIQYLGLILFFLSGFKCTGQTIVQGVTRLDSAWTQMIYASYVESFYDLYKISEHLIIARSSIDEAGNWELSLPQNDYPYLVRLHVSKIGDPAASLIIGTNDENHCFLAVNNEDTIKYLTNDTTSTLSSFSTENSGLNYRMLDVLELANKWEQVDRNTIGSENKIAIRNDAATELLRYADTTSSILPAIYAAHLADFGFNKSEIESSINTTKNRLGDHPYFGVYPTSNNTYLQYIVIFSCIAFFALTTLRIKVFYQRRKRQTMISTLSIREREVLNLLIAGSRNKEIADKLYIEVSTVKSHVNRIYEKLKVSSRKDLSRFS